MLAAGESYKVMIADPPELALDVASTGRREIWRPVSIVTNRHLPLVPVVLVGFATGFYRLGAKGLWGDEVWQISWSQQQSYVETFLRFRAPPDLPLHFIFTKLASDISTSEFVDRLPSALLGVATVVLLYLFGRMALGKWTGLAAALLLAVAPYHVWYTQDARPYASLACYSLLSLYFFAGVLKRPTVWLFVGFTLANLLNVYNQLFSLFALLVEGLAVVAWSIYMLSKYPGAKGAEKPRLMSQVRRVLIGFSISLVVVFLLSWPLHEGIANYLLHGGSGEVGASPFVPDLGFVGGLFGDFGAGASEWFYLFAAFALIGIASGLFRKQYMVLLLLAWLAVPFLVLWVAQPHHIFHPRYFLFLQPVYLILVALGVLEVGRLLAGVLQRLFNSGEGKPVHLGPMLSSLLAVCVLAVTFVPTWRIYWVEKINDWSGICSYLRQHVETGDAVIGDGYIDGIEYWCFQMIPGAPSVTIGTSRNYDVIDLARSGQTTWYLSLDAEDLITRLGAEHYEEVPRSTWARADLTPAPSDGTRLSYPQTEPPVRIYRYKSDHAPDHLIMHEVHGDAVVKGWPDYAQVNPQAHRSYRMGLATGRPRSLRINYLALVNRDLSVKVDDEVIGTLESAGNEGWTWADLQLPSGVGASFTVDLADIGTETAAWSELQVVYSK